eukprot:TRINITY_DN2192_c0_g2_i2.p1 TRINITY_DN2192_c0_g2~~TRINITY_DN2192_c0_g2_i2.p1  ORF type:complete len:337 (-),score=40.17 TRINITY_DN2192_c0_g2_i2:950-1960(-)
MSPVSMEEQLLIDEILKILVINIGLLYPIWQRLIAQGRSKAGGLLIFLICALSNIFFNLLYAQNLISRNFYQTLGVPRNAGDSDLREAYERVLEKTSETEIIFQTLTNPRLRRLYDIFNVILIKETEFGLALADNFSEWGHEQRSILLFTTLYLSIVMMFIFFFSKRTDKPAFAPVVAYTLLSLMTEIYLVNAKPQLLWLLPFLPSKTLWEVRFYIKFLCPAVNTLIILFCRRFSQTELTRLLGLFEKFRATKVRGVLAGGEGATKEVESSLSEVDKAITLLNPPSSSSLLRDVLNYILLFVGLVLVTLNMSSILPIPSLRARPEHSRPAYFHVEF